MEQKYSNLDVQYKKGRLSASVPPPVDGKMGSLMASIIYSPNDGGPDVDKITKKVEKYIESEKKKGYL